MAIITKKTKRVKVKKKSQRIRKNKGFSKKISVKKIIPLNSISVINDISESIVELDEIEDIVDEVEEVEEKQEPKQTRDMLEQIMFRLPCVSDPLIGTPKQVREELDALAKKMQRRPHNNKIFDKIHLYIHGYLINVVLKKFPFIKGLQTVDIYQETLIALRFKAIPNFKYGKGMSFLNFAKMCIRRHLITLLNASKNRKKDQSMNQAISLDSSPNRDDDDDSKTTYANIIADNKSIASKSIETNEAYEVTKNVLFNSLSDFEKVVLNEYLSSSSYKEMSKNISVTLKKRANTKSIDNALLRIRKKATYLLEHCRKEDLPIFLPKNNN